MTTVTDLAVYGLPGKGDVLVFPADLVAKRWQRREANFLEHSSGEIVASIRSIAETGEARA